MDGLCSSCIRVPPEFPSARQDWTWTLGEGEKVQAGYRGGCRLCGLVLRQLELDDDSTDIQTKLRNCTIKLTINASIQYQLLCQCIPNNFDSMKSAKLAVSYSPGSTPRAEKTWDAAAAKSVLSQCDKSHDCYRDPVELPTRLLDLESFPWIRLIETKKTNLDKTGSTVPLPSRQYAALSYCWGSSPAFTTTSSTIEGRMLGFDINQPGVPLTIVESAQVAKDLGLRYLWVDALCIVQGKDEKAYSDWKSESERMNLVYAGAYVTIVAAGSSDSNGGLICGKPTCIIPRPGQGDDAVLTLDVSNLKKEWRKEAILSRAWACQEWYLSSRRLVFTSTEQHFTCKREKLPKRGMTHASFNAKLPNPQTEPWAREWHGFVVNFAARNMSNPTDKLPALAGLARKFHEVGGDALGGYRAGLWEKMLLPGLLWRLEDWDDVAGLVLPAVFKRGRCLIKPDDEGSPSDKTPKPRAPSWSWAAVDGPIKFGAPSLSIDASVVHVTGCQTDLSDPKSPYGEVKSGVLTIRCPFTTGSLSRADGGRCLKVNGSSSIAFWGDDPSEMCNLLRGGAHKLHLLSFGKDMGIAVVPSPGSEGFYQRVGYFTLQACFDRFEDPIEFKIR